MKKIIFFILTCFMYLHVNSQVTELTNNINKKVKSVYIWQFNYKDTFILDSGLYYFATFDTNSVLLYDSTITKIKNTNKGNFSKVVTKDNKIRLSNAVFTSPDILYDTTFKINVYLSGQLYSSKIIYNVDSVINVNYKYDKNKQLIAIEENSKNVLIRIKNISYKFNKKGLVTKEKWRYQNSDSYVKIENEYDENNNILEQNVYSVGVDTYKNLYNLSNQLIEKQHFFQFFNMVGTTKENYFYNESSKLVRIVKTSAINTTEKTILEYDSKQNLIVYKIFDEQNNLVTVYKYNYTYFN